MHHIYKIGYLNDNNFEFTPQKCTPDAAMAVKQFMKPEMARGRVVIVASLDVKEVFDAAWRPSILKGLRDVKCPQNLFQLTQEYFRQ